MIARAGVPDLDCVVLRSRRNVAFRRAPSGVNNEFLVTIQNRQRTTCRDLPQYDLRPRATHGEGGDGSCPFRVQSDRKRKAPGWPKRDRQAERGDLSPRSAVNYDQERAQHVLLQNAKLKVQLRLQKGELLPKEEACRAGAELGSAIRKVVTRIHRLAPSLEGQSTKVIEERLKEEEDGILMQLNMIDSQIEKWEQQKTD